MGVRLRLINHEAFVERMNRKRFSNRQLAKQAKVAPGTIDNLVRRRTQSVNCARTAQLICQALDVPVDLFFVSETGD